MLPNEYTEIQTIVLPAECRTTHFIHINIRHCSFAWGLEDHFLGYSILLMIVNTTKKDAWFSFFINTALSNFLEHFDAPDTTTELSIFAA